MQTKRIPRSRPIPMWMGWAIILAVIILGHLAWVSIALELWRLLILGLQY